MAAPILQNNNQIGSSVGLASDVFNHVGMISHPPTNCRHRIEHGNAGTFSRLSFPLLVALACDLAEAAGNAGI